MSDGPIRFSIPSGFIVDRLRLTPAEIVYGYREGWLRGQDVVGITLAAVTSGAGVTPAEEELALLLSDDLGQVPHLMDGLAGSLAEDDAAWGAWLFLALAWVHEHRSEYADPLEVVESLRVIHGGFAQ